MTTSAPVTVVEFSDYQCPFCGRVTPTLKRLRDTYGDRLRIIWKDFPLRDIHPNASKAAEAAHCAGEQGKYWEYHDKLFASQSALAPDSLKEHAASLGIDPAAFSACLESSRYAARILQGIEEGRTLGIDSTPTLFINGRKIDGALERPYYDYALVLEQERGGTAPGRP